MRIRPARDVERMKALAASARFQRGDLDAEADYYRIHFRLHPGGTRRSDRERNAARASRSDRDLWALAYMEHPDAVYEHVAALVDAI